MKHTAGKLHSGVFALRARRSQNHKLKGQRMGFNDDVLHTDFLGGKNQRFPCRTLVPSIKQFICWKQPIHHHQEGAMVAILIDVAPLMHLHPGHATISRKISVCLLQRIVELITHIASAHDDTHRIAVRVDGHVSPVLRDVVQMQATAYTAVDLLAAAIHGRSLQGLPGATVVERDEAHHFLFILQTPTAIHSTLQPTWSGNVCEIKSLSIARVCLGPVSLTRALKPSLRHTVSLRLRLKPSKVLPDILIFVFIFAAADANLHICNKHAIDVDHLLEGATPVLSHVVAQRQGILGAFGVRHIDVAKLAVADVKHDAALGHIEHHVRPLCEMSRQNRWVESGRRARTVLADHELDIVTTALLRLFGGFWGNIHHCKDDRI
mmetsp:Transcript_46778/g.111268  ORF Transcript_46778/g.111268 Transcript_46778/m.111268 type:complete len:379 (+) Transcript_46778:632-1768(+)